MNLPWKMWKKWRRMIKSHKLCTSLGENTVIEASIERRQSGGELHVGKDGLIRGTLVLERAESRIRIGDRVAIGGGTILDCAQEIVIEDDVILSYDCLLADSDNHSILFQDRKNDVANWKKGFHDWSKSAMAPIRIGRGAWIGARACILKGVQVGEGAVVGMGSVVTRNVEPRTVVAGNPARMIRRVE